MGMPVLCPPEIAPFKPVWNAVRRIVAASWRMSFSISEDGYFVSPCSLLVVLAWRGRFRPLHAAFLGGHRA